jgi:hypothetical protein
VVVSFKVAIFNSVAGLVTNVSTAVLCCAALDLANSAQSKFSQASPASASVGVIEPNPFGALVVVFAKKA